MYNGCLGVAIVVEILFCAWMFCGDKKDWNGKRGDEIFLRKSSLNGLGLLRPAKAGLAMTATQKISSTPIIKKIN